MFWLPVSSFMKLQGGSADPAANKGDHTMPTEDQATALNRIVALCRDGIAFYENAASRIDNPKICDLLMKIARQRAEAVGELAPLVEADGEELRDSGTLAGATHRFLAELQADLSQDQTIPLVAQLVEYENRTIVEIQDLLENVIPPRTLPDETWRVLHARLNLFKDTREQMAALHKAL